MFAWLESLWRAADSLGGSAALGGLALAGGAALLWSGRLGLRAAVTLPALAFTPRLSRILSRRVVSVDASLEELLAADGAGPRFVERRRAALERLSRQLEERYRRSSEWGRRVRERFSDLRFTDANRVPFPFRKQVSERFDLCSAVTASRGPWLLDLDQRWTLDVSGAYGVNVAGFERYKEWMHRGLERVRDLGPVLGPLHPVVLENVEALAEISGQDEVSFHMSGTEAVMAAVRMARHNTRRRRIVTFSGAYHGWWDGVQPGLGSEREIPDCLALKDLAPASLRAIRWRAREIAAVLVNPVQCFHPNAPPPSDAVLLTSEARKSQDAAERYASWLHELRRVCTEAGIPLLFDEVYTGFRLAPGGAQEYFGVRADMVVYGKTVAGGFPIGVVCGRRDLMRRFDPDHPMRVAYVIGTFSGHPAVMGAMREFLGWVREPETAELYQMSNERCRDWVVSANRALEQRRLPLRIAHMATVWTVLFTEPSRFGWLLQYYLRAEGVNLSWVGTGRCLASFDFEPKDYEELSGKILAAATAMKDDGWWPSEDDEPGRERKIRMRLVREMVSSLLRFPKGTQAFYAEVMQRKADDHDASHHNLVNQAFHFISSSVFIACYGLAFSNLRLAMWLGLPALFLRQLGHAVFEPDAREKEGQLLGFNTPSKSVILATYLVIPAVHLLLGGEVSWEVARAVAPAVAQSWFLFTLAVVFGRVALLCYRFGLWSSSIWFVKLVTDPFSDIVTYAPHRLRRAA